MRHDEDALASARRQVAAVRDDPAGRAALLARAFRHPAAHGGEHVPYRRAAMSFMRWQQQRGLLNPTCAPHPGSPWWRAVNEALLRDTLEAAELVGGAPGTPSSRAVRLWLAFREHPSGRRWYRAHNATIVAGYLAHQPLAERERPAERHVMNIVLLRVLYAHALAAAPRLALGPLAPLGRALADPRLGMAGIFLSLRRVLPGDYPLTATADRYVAGERGLGRLLDFTLITPRLPQLYDWSAAELGEPRLRDLLHAGRPTYARPGQPAAWPAPASDPISRLAARLTHTPAAPAPPTTIEQCASPIRRTAPSTRREIASASSSTTPSG